MSLAGRWMRRVRFGLLCRSLYRDQYASQMMRVGLFQPVHVKTLASQKRRAHLAARKILQEKALAIENDIRGLLRNFGLKVGIVGVVGFEQRIHDLVEGVPELADIMEPLLAARRVLREKFAKLHRKVLLLARDNEVCQTDRVGFLALAAGDATLR